MTNELFDTPETTTDGLSGTAGGTGRTASDSPGSGRSTTDTAKEQVQDVAHEGVHGGKHVASVATDQAKEVASEPYFVGRPPSRWRMALRATRPILKNASAFAYTHPWTSVVVLTVVSMVLHYVVGVAGSAAPWPPCAATDSGCHWFQVASRDS